MNTLIPTPTLVHTNGSDKFTSEAAAVRRTVAHELTGNGNMPAFLVNMNISQLFEIWQFTQQKAFAFFEKTANLSRREYRERQIAAVNASFAFSQAEHVRWSQTDDLDDATLAVEPAEWFYVR